MKKNIFLILLALISFSCINKSSETIVAPGSIKGGFIPTPGSWPSVGMLLNSDNFLCTCSLLTSDLVLTAGHCISGFGTSNLSVVFQESITGKLNSPIRSRIEEVYAHPFYNSDSNEYDLAVIKLKTPIDTALIHPIPLIKSTEWETLVKEQQGISLVGYGMTETSYPDWKYRQVDVTLFDISDLTFKAGNPEKLAMSGDSGGPAFLKLIDGSYRQVGIAHTYVDGLYNLYMKATLVEDIYKMMPITTKIRNYLKSIFFPGVNPKDNLGTLESNSLWKPMLISGNKMLYEYPPRMKIYLDDPLTITVYFDDLEKIMEKDSYFPPTTPRTFKVTFVASTEDIFYYHLDQTAFRYGEISEDGLTTTLPGKLYFDGKNSYRLTGGEGFINIDLTWTRP